jgi:hypothetical protein
MCQYGAFSKRVLDTENIYHHFELRCLRPCYIITDIDQLIAEGFSIFINNLVSVYFIVGVISKTLQAPANDKSLCVDVSQHLESKNVTFLSIPSDCARTSELLQEDLSGRSSSESISNHLEELDSLQYGGGTDPTALSGQEVKALLDRLPQNGRLSDQYTERHQRNISDFIVLVIKIGSTVVALPPIVTNLARMAMRDSTVVSKKPNETIINCLLTDDPLKHRLEKMAVEKFRSLDKNGRAVWARMEIRYDKDSGSLHLIDFGTPLLFHRRGAPADPSLLVVYEALAGAENALFDILVSTCRSFQGLPDTATVSIAYDEMAPVYDEVITTQEVYSNMYKHLIRTFDFRGTILDLACGTGMFARCLRAAGVRTTISGIDISPASILRAQRYYDTPIMLGDIWTEMMKEDSTRYDHISCFGALHFFDAIDFTALLVRMLMRARKSVSFEVDDLSQEYLDRIELAEGPGWRNYNNIEALQAFGVPKGWAKVLEKRTKLYRSPATGVEVSCIQVRFERMAPSALEPMRCIWG